MVASMLKLVLYLFFAATIFLSCVFLFLTIYLSLKRLLKAKAVLEGGIEEFKILYVIPGKDTDKSFPFSRRQVKFTRTCYGIKTKIFFLESRNSISQLVRLGISFQKLEREFNPHIIHCHYGSVTALFTVLFAKAPVIITYHGSDLNVTPWVGTLRDKIGRACSQWAALGADKIICVSKQLKDLLYWRKKASSVIPIGTDVNEFYPQNKEHCRELLNWKRSEKVILFNANKPKIKRLDIALKVVENIFKKIPEIRLEILDGTISPQVLPVYINASDCVLLCSDSEGSPTIVKEAMSCNVPVVGIPVGDLVENLEGVSPGGVYEKIPESLASGIIDVINSNTPSNGRQHLINRGLSSQVLDTKVMELYLEVVKVKFPKNLLKLKEDSQVLHL